MKQINTLGTAIALSVVLSHAVHTEDFDQSEAEIQELMPVTGSVRTSFGDLELDHSSPAPGEVDRIYDLMDWRG